MSIVRDQAIVLRRLDYSETSQVLAVFTRDHGQQRLIAKGIKRGTKTRASTGIDLLELGAVMFSLRPGKEGVLATMTEWRQEENFAHLRRDLVRSYAAQYAAEATAQLTEVHDPHPGLFDALAAMLHALREGEPLARLDQFLWALLTEIGLRPELDHCMSCGRSVHEDRVAYLSSRQGGAICRDCEPAVVEKRRTSGDVISWLADGAAADAGPMKQSFDLLDYYITETVGKPLRLAEPLRAMVGLASQPKPR
ncbi:MAG: DNA repair protein RecO [Planctomycetota bacterium]